MGTEVTMCIYRAVSIHLRCLHCCIQDKQECVWCVNVCLCEGAGQIDVPYLTALVCIALRLVERPGIPIMEHTTV